MGTNLTQLSLFVDDEHGVTSLGRKKGLTYREKHMATSERCCYVNNGSENNCMIFDIVNQESVKMGAQVLPCPEYCGTASCPYYKACK